MKKSFKQKVLEEIKGVKYEQTKIDERDFSNRKPFELRFKNSTSQSILYIFPGITIIILTLIPNEVGVLRIVEVFSIHWAFGTFVILLPVALIYLSIKTLIDRKLKLVVNYNGIWTPTFEYQWSEVIETGFKFVKRRSVYLIVKTELDDVQVDLSGLAVNTRFLGHQIELMKKPLEK